MSFLLSYPTRTLGIIVNCTTKFGLYLSTVSLATVITLVVLVLHQAIKYCGIVTYCGKNLEVLFYQAYGV